MAAKLVPEPEEFLDVLFKIPEDLLKPLKPVILRFEPRIREINAIASLGKSTLEPIALTIESIREINYLITAGLRVPYKILHTIEEITDVLLKGSK